MKIIRLKCVSQCLGIRRVEVSYTVFENKSLDLSKKPHPLNSFNGLSIINDSIKFNDQVEKLLVGEDVFLYRNMERDSLGKKVIETCALGAMLLDIEPEMEEYYLKAIEEDYVFDEFDGEFEYLLGIMSEYTLKDTVKANLYYQKALDKKFRFFMI